MTIITSPKTTPLPKNHLQSNNPSFQISIENSDYNHPTITITLFKRIASQNILPKKFHYHPLSNNQTHSTFHPNNYIKIFPNKSNFLLCNHKIHQHYYINKKLFNLWSKKRVYQYKHSKSYQNILIKYYKLNPIKLSLQKNLKSYKSNNQFNIRIHKFKNQKKIKNYILTLNRLNI
jgi:hypothetical protein